MKKTMLIILSIILFIFLLLSYIPRTSEDTEDKSRFKKVYESNTEIKNKEDAKNVFTKYLGTKDYEEIFNKRKEQSSDTFEQFLQNEIEKNLVSSDELNLKETFEQSPELKDIINENQSFYIYAQTNILLENGDIYSYQDFDGARIVKKNNN